MIARIAKAAGAAILTLAAGLVVVPVQSAEAGLLAKVDLSSQRMEVYVDGKKKYTWKVSTGRKGYRTPTGSFTPYNMKKFVYSKKWKMSLPHTVWVTGSVAIHGTTLTSRLGRVASHGCIRLAPRNAARFYSMVKDHGLWFTTVKVVK